MFKLWAVDKHFDATPRLLYPFVLMAYISESYFVRRNPDLFIRSFNFQFTFFSLCICICEEKVDNDY